ncbi:MAG: rhamnulose-1-phosphate aldolase [Dehalococcoidales bacterium]
MAEISLSKELQKIVDDVAEVTQYLWQKGWAARNAGNISVDITGLIPERGVNLEQFPKIPVKISSPELAGRCFLVTTTGSRFRELARQPQKNLLIVRMGEKLDGYHILWGGEPESRPTAEFVAHLKIHGLLRRHNSSQKVVLHGHPGPLIALTHLEDYGKDTFQRFLWSTHVSVKFFLPEGVGMAPYQAEGSEELAEVTVNLFQHHKAVLWQKHGCTTIGTDVADAFDLMDMLNNAAEVFLLCKSAGYEPGLNQQQLAELKRIKSKLKRIKSNR